MKRNTMVRLLVAGFTSLACVANAATTNLAALVASNGVWVNSSSYTPPVFDMYSTSYPCVTAFYNAFGPLAVRWQNVPMPCYFSSSPGTDGEAVIRDYANNKTYEFFGAKYTTTAGWQADWGGADVNTAFVTTPYGRQWPRPGGVNYGTQASGLAFIPGLILESELRAGVIPHAIHLLVPTSCTTWKYPATRTDGNAGNNNPATCVQLGQVWKLPASVNISNLPPFVRMIAQAAKTYGIVATDQTLGAVGFRVENWQRKWSPWGSGDGWTDPYMTVGGHFGCNGLQNGQPAAYGLEYDCYPDHNNLFYSFPWGQLVPQN